MKTVRVKSLAEFRRILVKDLRGKEKRLQRAAERTAKLHAAYLRKNIPVAFGELRAAVHVVGTVVMVDAPHAAAVERGSRPHWVPLDALLKWVKLRGFQGLASDKAQSRLPGTTTVDHARRVAGQLEDARRGPGGIGPATPYSGVDDALGVAKAIQLAIALKGTQPQWYMRNSVPTAQGFLRVEVHKALAGG